MSPTPAVLDVWSSVRRRGQLYRFGITVIRVESDRPDNRLSAVVRFCRRGHCSNRQLSDSVRPTSNCKDTTRVQDSPRRVRTDSRHNVSIVTRAMPLNPRACAPAGVRSIIRPRMNGPRSFTLTMTDLPLPTFVTRTFVPKARVRCAAVKAPDVTRSPFAVFGPLLAV